jgi:hypothetical protein
VQVATRTPQTQRRESAQANAAADVAQIRKWAAANGVKVSARGRLAADVIAAYQAAH